MTPDIVHRWGLQPVSSEFTGRFGRVAFTVAPRGTTTYELVFGGTHHLAAAQSPAVTVFVRVFRRPHPKPIHPKPFHPKPFHPKPVPEPKPSPTMPAPTTPPRYHASGYHASGYHALVHHAPGLTTTLLPATGPAS